MIKESLSVVAINSNIINKLSVAGDDTSCSVVPLLWRRQQATTSADRIVRSKGCTEGVHRNSRSSTHTDQRIEGGNK